jgi:NADPH-dependent 2,4-dienoyl-CoA reductase/sulfur reductase-like enzyme
VGGGYTGLEMAEAFQHRGIATRLITRGPTVLARTLDADLAGLVGDRMRETGIELETGVALEVLEGREGRVTAAGSGDAMFEADIVVLALGSRPEVELARDAGIPLGESGAVWVDTRQRTGVPAVWAAGDCAESSHRVSGRPVNIHLGTIANKQGRVAGINLGGGDAEFPGVLGTAITKVCELEIARTGLTECEATEARLDYVATSFDSTTTAAYWPDAQPMTMKALAERGSGRLLGAQIVGGAGSGKRIDAVATALWNEMTVDEMINIDLAYAPPFSGVWDPMLVAARKAHDALGGR